MLMITAAAAVATASAATTRNLMTELQTENSLAKIAQTQLKAALGSQDTAQ